ncbi:MAG: hypothetical protein K2L86_12255 [Lachnospiraceae bacterium]|nr:hypothetical protein [Lachnospiraceae bacterium]
MRGKDLLKCMEYMDDILIEEALNPTEIWHGKNMYTKSTVMKWSMAAACVLVVSVSATVFWAQQRQIYNQDTRNTEIAVQMDSPSNDTSDIRDSDDNKDDTGLPAAPAAEHTSKGVLTESITTDTDMDTTGMDMGAWDAVEDTASAKQSATHAGQDKEENRAAAEEALKTAYTVLNDYYGEKEDAVYDYPMPEKGTLLCYHYLQETINYYSTQENAADTVDHTIYAYQVVIDLYGDVETAKGVHYQELYHADEGYAVIEQEYRRLIDLGYAVRLSEDFQLTGTFTKTEIDTFPAAPEYGYVFRFESEV